MAFDRFVPIAAGFAHQDPGSCAARVSPAMKEWKAIELRSIFWKYIPYLRPVAQNAGNSGLVEADASPKFDDGHGCGASAVRAVKVGSLSRRLQ